MPTNIKDYSTTQASNTSLNGISTAEGMLPSNLNNAIRALMKNTRDWFNDAQWIEYGDGSGAYTALSAILAFVTASSAILIVVTEFDCKFAAPKISVCIELFVFDNAPI